MAKDFLKANPAKEFENQLNADLNTFVREALIKLSRKENPYSPIDTGFFASSWTVGRSRPVPEDRRENVAPWSNIKPTRKGDKSPQAKVEPRFINNINYNFKIYERFYIGNSYVTKSFVAGIPESLQYIQFTLTGSLDATGSHTYNNNGISYQENIELDYDAFKIKVHRPKTELKDYFSINQ